MAYQPGYSFGGIGWNDKAAYDRYTSGQGQFKKQKGINPNVPGWGDWVDPDWRLIGFGGDPGGRTEDKHGIKYRPDTSFAIMERIGYQPPQQSAPAPAPNPYGPGNSSLNYSDPGDKGFFGMMDYNELLGQGASKEQIMDYARKSPYGVGNKVAGILGLQATSFDPKVINAPPPPEIEVPEPEPIAAPPSSAQPGGPGDEVASFATGWRSARGRRQKAGPAAQGTGSMKNPLSKALGIGVNLGYK